MTQRIRLATILPLLLITSLLTACGFHLRGKMDVNSELSRISVTGSDIQYVHNLSRVLNHDGIAVTDNAAYRLNVLNVSRNTNKQAQSIAGRYERQLTFAVTYQLETSDGLALFSPVNLSKTRYISYDQNRANAGQSEEDIAYKELSLELIDTTVRQIAGMSQTKLEAEVARARKVQQMEREEQHNDAQ